MKGFNHFLIDATANPKNGSQGTVAYRYSATGALYSQGYKRTIKSTVPNAKWYVFDAGRNEYLLIRDGLVIASIDGMEGRMSYEPDRFMWKTDYSQPHGGIGLGRGEKRQPARLVKYAIERAEQQILTHSNQDR